MMIYLRNKRRCQKGLCLPEILVSCLIALMGIVAILSAFLGGRLASTGAKHWTQATNLARARIEDLKSLRYVDVAAMPSVTVESDLALDDRGDGRKVHCSRTTTLTQEADGITISVLVAWNEKTAGQGFTAWTYDLKTWIGFPGTPGGIGAPMSAARPQEIQRIMVCRAPVLAEKSPLLLAGMGRRAFGWPSMRQSIG
jgi:Tfp pilus assembly protein PilV